MRLIRSVLLPLELKSGFASSRINANSMAGQSPYFVRLYEDLVRMTASISSYNPDYMVLFRGQNNDYLDDATGRSLIMPSIYRANNGRELSLEELDSRFDVLGTACSLLESDSPGSIMDCLARRKQDLPPEGLNSGLYCSTTGFARHRLLISRDPLELRVGLLFIMRTRLIAR